MKGEIGKWGNSLALRIPKSLAVESRLAEGSQIEIAVVRGRLVITPIDDHEHTLDQLLEGVTKANIHDEIDFGKPVGKEIL